MKKLYSIMAGVFMMSGFGIANAEQALTNDQMDGVSAGACTLCVYKDIVIKDFKDIKTRVDLQGNTAVAEGTADAFGPKTTAQVFTSTTTVAGYGSSAESTSISASQKW